MQVFHARGHCRDRNKDTESLIYEVKNLFPSQGFSQITARITNLKSSKSNLIIYPLKTSTTDYSPNSAQHGRIFTICVIPPWDSKWSNYMNYIEFLLCVTKGSTCFICSLNTQNNSVRLVLSCPTLQIKKLEHREVKQLVQVHPARKRGSQDTDPALSDFIACILHCSLFVHKGKVHVLFITLSP